MGQEKTSKNCMWEKEIMRKLLHFEMKPQLLLPRLLPTYKIKFSWYCYLWLCKNSVMRFLFSCVASTVTMSGFVVGAPVHGFRPIAKASHIRFTPENFLANIDNIKVYYMTYRCSPSAQFYLQVGSRVLLECKYVSSGDQTNEYVIILYTLIHAG